MPAGEGGPVDDGEVMKEGLLKQYIVEVLTGFGNKSLGKDNPSGNLFPVSVQSGDAQVKRRGGNIVADEQAEEDEQLQDRKYAACCLILSDDGRVLAVSRRDDPTAWGLPGGKVDPGETPMQAAGRELQEETGLTAKSLHQVFISEEHDGFITVTFACKPEGKINTSESGLVRWVTPDMLFAGPFGDYNRKLWAKLGLPEG